MSRLPTQHHNIIQQGFNCPANQLDALRTVLRITPLVCGAMTGLGLGMQSPVLLFLVGAIGVVSFWFPAGHPVDWLFNRFFAHRFAMPRLPPNPLPRRLACLAGGFANWLSASLFAFGLTTAALIIGIVLLMLQLIVTLTHFCALSWIIDQFQRKKTAITIDFDQARDLVKRGAVLIDVRGTDEAARHPVTGAINVPVTELGHYLEQLRNVPSILFCASGRRSAAAVEDLRRLRIQHAYNLGDVAAAQKLTAAMPII